MRHYLNFPEAYNELKRELKEMGIKVHSKSVQNLDIQGKPEYETLELQNYTYMILQPKMSDIPLKSPRWADAELYDRLCGLRINPGTAYKYREETWDPLRRADGKFDYTYPDRLSITLEPAIQALQKDLYTRRAFIPVFDGLLDDVSNFQVRIPCSIGYWLNYRNGKLNMTYLLRSSDFGEHFNYDIYLALGLLDQVCNRLGVLPGTFTHWIGSFHVFAKDVEGVF